MSAEPNIKYTVVIPLYNCGDYIEEACRSVIRQSLQSWELLVIDDGSTDHGPEVVRELAKIDSRINLYSKPNAGLAHTRNYGANLAKGKYLYFLDADDWIDLDTLECLHNCHERNNCQIVLFHGMVHDSNSNSVYPFYDSWVWEKIGATDYLNQNSPLFQYVVQIEPSACIRSFSTQYFQTQVLGFRVGVLFEDFTVHINALMNAQTIGLLNKPLFHYRVGRPGQITSERSSRRKDILIAFEDTLNDVKERYQKGMISIEVGAGYLRAIFRMIVWCQENLPDHEIPSFVSKCRSIFSTVPEEWIVKTLQEHDHSIRRRMQIYLLSRCSEKVCQRFAKKQHFGLLTIPKLFALFGIKEALKIVINRNN